MLIVDMPMPRCCENCDVEIYGICGITHENLLDERGNYNVKRPDWCPIKGELVHCGECKYYTKIDGYCPYYDSYFPADHICEHGKRKENNDAEK